jgi:ATP-dependent DNA ligase
MDQAAAHALGNEAPAGGGWLHEIKYDGYRMLARIDGPQIKRKERLQRLFKKEIGGLRYSEHVIGDGPGFRAEARRLGLEGAISKQADRPSAQKRLPHAQWPARLPKDGCQHRGISRWRKALAGQRCKRNLSLIH